MRNIRQPLFQMAPGTGFRQPDLEITGILLSVTECRARVRLDQPQELVEFIGPDGETRTFRAKRVHETSWAPTVVVEALSVEPLTERDMTMAATKKTSKKAPAKKTTKASSGKPAKTRKERAAKADGKLSQLDAAVKVLEEAKEPMTTKAMIDAMADKGYWTSPGGQTPAATLYSAILRELQKKGNEARFVKVERGQFALNAGTDRAAKPAAKATGKKTAKKGDAKPADGTPGPKSVSDLLKI
jgi:hypothetical protein